MLHQLGICSLSWEGVDRCLCGVNCKHCLRAEASTIADPLEEIREEHVWRWELRDAKVLPKAQRQQAQGIKKALLKVRKAAHNMHLHF